MQPLIKIFRVLTFSVELTGKAIALEVFLAIAMMASVIVITS
ncbi:hypothetical protein [Pseudanabaena sp. UWO310]|nr:hypothetical protein [Pseudanabaena sp. UWO310]